MPAKKTSPKKGPSSPKKGPKPEKGSPKKSAAQEKSQGGKYFSNVALDAFGRMTFHADGLHVSVLNAIRRACLSDVPNVALFFDPYAPESVLTMRFLKNTSALNNEFMGRRLSLVPVCVDEEEVAKVAENPRRYKFVVDARNTGTSVLSVTSKDIKVMDESGNTFPESVRDAMFPPDPITGDYIELVRLKPSAHATAPGEELHVEMRASVGTASEHARYSPVSLCTYVYRLDPDIASQAKKEYLAQRAADNTNHDHDHASNHFDTIEAPKRCHARDAYGEPTSFLFSVETECALRPAYLIAKSIAILGDKVARLRGSTELDLARLSSDGELFELRVAGEGHTLGNLLQAYIFNTEVRHNQKKTVAYVGYYQPHPLETSFVMKLRFASSVSDVDEVRAFLEAKLDSLADFLAEVGADWAKASSAL